MMETKYLTTRNHCPKQTKDNSRAMKANTGKGMVNKTPIGQKLEVPKTVGRSLNAKDKKKEYQIEVCKERYCAELGSEGSKINETVAAKQ